LGDMLKGVQDMFGGGKDKKDPSDFDDDGLIDSDHAEAIKALKTLTVENIKRRYLPRLPRAILHQNVEFAPSAKEGDDAVTLDFQDRAAKRFAKDAELKAHDIDFSFLDATMLGQKFTISNWWIVKCGFDGKDTTMVFDTGAASMIVLDQKFANSLDIGASLTIQVKGVGESESTFGLVNSYNVAGQEFTEEYGAIVLDLAALSDQIGALSNLGIKVETPSGLLGLPYAMRHKSMVVNNLTKKISFVPYTAEEIKEVEFNPYESNSLVVEAVKKTWDGSAGSTGFLGEPLNLVDWPEEAAEGGGVVVTQVRKGSGAEKNGLEKGDLILAIVGDPNDPSSEEQEPVTDYDSLKLFAAYVGKGQTWSLLIKKKRSGKKIVQDFELGPVKSSKIVIPKRYKKE
ncbi:MAG: hypothetical protein KDB07_12675, partial [Planctomycetes bacterium]|nr:hypothetical protein [Planctomycetota bacterium]